MVKIISELEKIGLEITDEQKESIKKSMGEELYSKQELDKKIGKVEAERDNYKERAETAEGTLKGFEGKDFDEITKDRDEWKKKAEQAEQDFNAKIAERDKNDLLEKAFKDVKFSSESAKKSIMTDIAASVTVKDGKLIGFNDLLEDAKKSDAGAFVDEQEQQSQQNQATFTAPMGTKTEPITGDPNKMDFATYKKWREQNQ
jgi:phage minor structural protein GP20|uniref:Minor structural protein n=1 Tax=Myoviridae sp. ctvns3 TaxID=2825204 RepID=A0A8S5PBY5_9CAUD|nr:MAG TPA: minor structural protein [Myoviridae sp. ctvns3]